MDTDNHGDDIPDGFELTRTTDVFDNDTVPAGLLKAHRVADSIWGRLVVYTGTVGFVFEEEADQPCSVDAGASVVGWVLLDRRRGWITKSRMIMTMRAVTGAQGGMPPMRFVMRVEQRVGEVSELRVRK